MFVLLSGRHVEMDDYMKYEDLSSHHVLPEEPVKMSSCAAYGEIKDMGAQKTEEDIYSTIP